VLGEPAPTPVAAPNTVFFIVRSWGGVSNLRRRGWRGSEAAPQQVAPLRPPPTEVERRRCLVCHSTHVHRHSTYTHPPSSRAERGTLTRGSATPTSQVAADRGPALTLPSPPARARASALGLACGGKGAVWNALRHMDHVFRARVGSLATAAGRAWLGTSQSFRSHPLDLLLLLVVY
jgi:hypothetical protein